jgi:OOP family OmpA-OmpF porin
MVIVAKSSKRSHASTAALAAGTALACFLAAPVASAQFSRTQEFQTGFSLLRFEPAGAGDRFFQVRDAFVPGNTESRFRALLLADFATAPILSRTDNLNGQTVDVISKQSLLNLGLGYFPVDALYFDLNLPLVLSQSGDSTTTPSGAAVGDTRLGVRYGLVGSENAGFSFGPALDVWVPTGSQDKLTGDGKLRALPMLALSGREDIFVWSANLGYQFRRHIDIGSVEVGNSYTFGAAAGLLVLHDVLQVGPELYGAALSSPSQGATFGSQNTMLEALFGAKVHAGDFVFGAAAGPGLARAPGTAPRFLLSAAFAPQAPYVHEAEAPPPKPEPAPEPEAAEPAAAKAPEPPPDRDGDGIPDADDACPDQHGDASDDKTKNGCPPPAAPAAPAPGEEDTDGDGIPDNEDACKRVKGVASDIPHLNGCPPPVDTDGDGIPDENDACPKKSGVSSSDPKLNGCPPPPPPPPPRDSDADGIPDKDDACPRRPGIASDDPKLNGCPAPKVKAPVVKAVAAPPLDSDGDGIPDRLDACPQEPGVHSHIAKKNGCPTQILSTRPGGPALVTFEGFRSFDDGTSLVFVELSGPVTVDVKKAHGAIVYTLENAKVPVRNNRNPLLTIDFSSIVRRATIAQKKKSVELSISLKADLEPEQRLVQRGGATVLEIRFPKPPPGMAPPPADDIVDSPPLRNPQEARPHQETGGKQHHHHSSAR